MKKSLCGADCESCFLKDSCRGCAESDGCPFGKKCICASALQTGPDGLKTLKEALIREFRSLGIPELSGLSELNALKGSFINLPFSLPNGETVKLWDDDKIYLGNQIEKKDGRCLGLAADEHNLCVCTYDRDGQNPELILYKQWKERCAK